MTYIYVYRRERFVAFWYIFWLNLHQTFAIVYYLLLYYYSILACVSGFLTDAAGHPGILFLYSVNRNACTVFGIQRRLGFLHIDFLSTPVIGTAICGAPSLLSRERKLLQQVCRLFAGITVACFWLR